MGYLVLAKARSPNGRGEHSVQTRWRSDDPWGAIWRCLYDVLQGYIPWPPKMEPEHLAVLELRISFHPDKEDFVPTLFPDDALDQHRKINRKKKRNSKHGKIPQE